MNPPSHDAWNAALHIVKALRDAGFSALLAGGCVRDKLLSLAPKDFDVATSARPEQIKSIFGGAKLVGAKFGVAVVRKFGHDIEVATFRIDGEYSDGRHPDQVEFGSDRDDARRRDFTINGMFYDPIGEEIIDYVDGQADLSARVLRTIGEPEQRFTEDHLRMLRAVRFAARLEFQIEPRTMAAIQAGASNLRSISPERVWLELREILAAPSRATGWRLLCESSLTPHLSDAWPSAEPGDEDSLAAKRLAALPARRLSPSAGLAALLAGTTSAEVADVGKSLRLSNREISTTDWLVSSLTAVQPDATLELADLKLLLRHEAWPELMELLRADQFACGSHLGAAESVLARASSLTAEAINAPPMVSGDDLMAIGLKPSKDLGDLLKAVYRAQLNEELHTKEEALAWVRHRLPPLS